MSATDRDLLRELPSVGILLSELRDSGAEGVDPKLLGHLCRRRLEGLRQQILAPRKGEPSAALPDRKQLLQLLHEDIRNWYQPGCSRVVNGTGIILHSGLGRAVYPQAAIEQLAAADGYVLLEVDREEGARRKRDAFCEELLCDLTGAEAAIVVNNNAAATMIILNSLAATKEVVVSRSQLIEIGGSYRLPDVFTASGCRLREVGTTNKSRPSDYSSAINEDTGALMLVHTSNYRIVGFTEHVGLEEMIRIGKEAKVPVIHDVGSGSLIDLVPFGVMDEPPVSESIKAGADVVCFSGDKLIGGPQAGIIIGKKATIEKIRKNPLARALRIDKSTAIALETVLKLYFEPSKLAQNIPTLSMLTEPVEAVEKRALALQTRIEKELPQVQVNRIQAESELGAGTLPTHGIPSWCLTLQFPEMSASRAGRIMRMRAVPVFSRIKDDRLMLDLRTMTAADFDETLAALKAVLED